MVLFWGVRPEWEITWLPFLLPLGVELFLVASSATSAVLTALSLDSSFLESFFSAAYAALLRSSRDLCAGDFFDDDLDLDDDSFSSVDLLDEDFSRWLETESPREFLEAWVGAPEPLTSRADGMLAPRRFNVKWVVLAGGSQFGLLAVLAYSAVGFKLSAVSPELTLSLTQL